MPTSRGIRPVLEAFPRFSRLLKDGRGRILICRYGVVGNCTYGLEGGIRDDAGGFGADYQKVLALHRGFLIALPEAHSDGAVLRPIDGEHSGSGDASSTLDSCLI